MSQIVWAHKDKTLSLWLQWRSRNSDLRSLKDCTDVFLKHVLEILLPKSAAGVCRHHARDGRVGAHHTRLSEREECELLHSPALVGIG